MQKSKYTVQFLQLYRPSAGRASLSCENKYHELQLFRENKIFYKTEDTAPGV
jgi:hypothetical protein